MKLNEEALQFLKNNTQTNCARLFFGEYATQEKPWNQVSVEVFDQHLWITIWAKVEKENLLKLKEIFPEAKSAVLMDRSQIASEKVSEILWGTPPEGLFTNYEFGVPYQVQMLNTKHPGIFLDHSPLRHELTKTQKGKSVLNLFSYTASLSLAAAFGGASKVVSVDLSKTTTEWAKQSWEQFKRVSNSKAEGDFIYGDVFEWLPKLKKRGLMFDTILCDPPSFSRSKTRVFSTQKDLVQLHELIFPLLNKNGLLVTSINSEKVQASEFKAQIYKAAKLAGDYIDFEKNVALPEYERSLPFLPPEPYLKGFYVSKH